MKEGDLQRSPGRALSPIVLNERPDQIRCGHGSEGRTPPAFRRAPAEINGNEDGTAHSSPSFSAATAAASLAAPFFDEPLPSATCSPMTQTAMVKLR